MGNEFGIPTSKLGFTSIASTTPNIEKNDVEKLLNAVSTLAASRENPSSLSREDLLAGLKQMEKFTASDSELFVQLFTLFDHEGHDTVDLSSFITGSSFCLVSSQAVREKLLWGMTVIGGVDESIVRGDVKKLLLAINHAAAFFGDPVLAPTELDDVTIELFKTLPVVSGRVGRGEAVDWLLQHPQILKFMRGDGTVKFGSPELQL